MKQKLFLPALCLALCLAVLPARAGAAYTDITDETVATAAAALEGMGVVSGTSDSTFNPSGSLTRAQLSAMLVNAAGLSNQVSTYARKTMFSDVSASAWYNGYVNLAYSQGLVSGNGDGTFGPDTSVTYGEMATSLLRLLGYTSEQVGTVWPLDYTAFCDELGFSDGLSLGAYDNLNRGEGAVLLYRALKAPVSGSEQPYYETIEGVSSVEEVILLDGNASYGGSSGLLMAYAPSSGGILYYTQEDIKSDTLAGRLGHLLFDSSGSVLGFLPEDGGYQDLTIGTASAAELTDASGTSYRISSGAVVIAGGEVYDYSSAGYLQLNARTGRTVRLYYDDDGAVTYLYLSGGTAASSEAAVASTTSASSSLARALGLSGKTYTITKNGAAASSGDLTQYDVGYYDAATATLRVSDYRVSGFLAEASPSVTAATTLTVAGYTFDVLECAWETLGELKLGDKVTLLLTDDGKVAAAYPSTQLRAEMIGILAEDGRSVTLTGSGITLTADTMDYEESSLGSLVEVSATAASALHCKEVSSSSLSLDLAEGVLGDLKLAPSCMIYEWAGSGRVYDLEGNPGTASTDFSAITWTETLDKEDVAYYHTNSADQVDVILLENVTGSCYEYGKITRYSAEEGINLGGSSMDAYNPAATLTNSAGQSEKYLCAISSSSDRYVGVALTPTSSGYERVSSIRRLRELEGIDNGDFFLQDSVWYVEAEGNEYRVSEQVEIHLSDADLWLSGADGLASALADGYELTLYYDQAPDEGGQIRIVVAE